MPRTPPPLTSFSPELLEALILGSKQSIELPLPSYRLAVQYQQRLNSLRHRLLRDNHEMASAVSATKVLIRWPPDTPELKSSKNVRRPVDRETPCTLVIEPRDVELTSALRRAGVAIKPLAPPLADEEIGDFLERFKNSP